MDSRRIKFETWAAWALAVACVLAACAVAADTIWAARAAVFQVPVMDQWSFLNRLRLWQTGGQSFRELLWRQHNEHRLVLDFLILVLDAKRFRALGSFALACIWTFQAAHACLWLWRHHAVEKSATARLAYIGLVLGIFFSATQFENFIWPFQANFIAVFFLASAALVCFIAHCRNGAAASLAAALALAVAATFCMANGALLWPVFIALALLEHAPRRSAFAVAATGAACAAAYLKGYATPGQLANPLLSWLHPGLLTGYLGVYFFNFWARLPNVLTPERAGALVEIIFIASFAAYAARRIKGGARDYAFYAYSSLFLFATGVLTALGRVNLGWGQAGSSRYCTPALLFWACLASEACLFLGRRRNQVWKILGPPIIAAAVLAEIILPGQRQNARAAEAWAENVNVSGLSLAVGVFDPQAWRRLYPDSGMMVRQVLPYLKSQRLSIFSGPDARKLGQPLSSFLAQAKPGACSGSFSGFIPLAPISGQDLAGRAFGEGWIDPARPVQTVFITDQNGIVVGLARGFTPATRLDSAADPLTGKWGGYARSAPGTTRLIAYAALPDGRAACLLGALNPEALKQR